MSDPSCTTPLPARRPSLVLRTLADLGQCVVKDGQGGFYDLDEQSYFLLTQLDGRSSADEVRAAYQARFTEPLAAEELAEFVAAARADGFLQEDDPPSPSPPTPLPRSGGEGSNRSSQGGGEGSNRSSLGEGEGAAALAPSGNSLLFFRLRLIDPDRLLTWLAPRLWFFWTPAFVLLATACTLAAAVIVWARRADLAPSFTDALAWRTVVLAWVALGVVTVLHEFAHGLTCKHFGGEVRDMGFLLLFFMPCFYANVSDAWLFPRRSQRLWVTFAGGFFELWLWALAVLAWAVLQPGTLPCRTAFVIVTLCGVQTLFNFNPLLKLDGYYLLSDWLGLVNLRERAQGYTMARLRRWLWGAAAPEPDPHRRVLLTFGLLSLAYSLAVLAVGLFILAQVGGRYLGAAGWAAVGLLALLSLRGVFRGFFQG